MPKVTRTPTASSSTGGGPAPATAPEATTAAGGSGAILEGDRPARRRLRLKAPGGRAQPRRRGFADETQAAEGPPPAHGRQGDHVSRRGALLVLLPLIAASCGRLHA